VTSDHPVARAIAASGWEQLAADLVRLPSHPGIERQEECVARTLADWLRARRVACTLDPVVDGRPNLIARSEVGGSGRTLLLCGHTDTVPLNDDAPGVGFSGDVRDGRLNGRGACDMKGALAAMAAAIAALALTRSLADGAVVFAAIVDEEMESLGAERLVASGLRADGAIVGEPTSNRLALGHKGLEWLEIAFLGRASHGGTPEAGINAIGAAARLCAAVEDELVPRLASRRHPLLGPPTINFGTVRGGDQPSTVAASCRLALDRRTVPGETYDGVVAELREILDAIERSRPGLTTSVRRVPGGMATLEHRPTVLDPAHPLAVAVEAARRTVTGRAEAPVAFPAWTDASLLSNFASIPCAILGPGDLALAHGPDESIPLSEIEEAASIYADAAMRFSAAGAPA